jgi:hypothetical protein
VRQVYSGAQTSHYVYSDATGAEYRLDVNSGGVWTSKEGVWVSYDTTYSPARLYWPDGSWWEMGSVSAGAEQDAGTQYPTKMWDTNGNWIEVGYAAGAGLGGTNSSARITRIRDTRPEVGDTYTFEYSNGHLSRMRNNIVSGEDYTFSYSASQPLNSPFTPSMAAGTGVMLQGVTQTGIGTTTSFEYWPGSGEMTRLTTALGGRCGGSTRRTRSRVEWRCGRCWCGMRRRGRRRTNCGMC